jgi:Domain of unknown function (DUF4442)
MARDLRMFDKFTTRINNPFYLRFFLITKLPSAYFSGVRLKYNDENKCITTVPYKWFSKNPFKSTYFACLSMAAEMCTGVLAMGHVYKKDPQVSMLVRKIEGNFLKKATGRTTFTCEDGQRIESAIKEAMASGKSVFVNTYASGLDKDGETIAEFIISWSFKAKIN